MSHKLILIRHGKSVWNLKNIFTGWVDVELDVQGEQEARLAVDLIKNADIVPTYAFTSYLKRAQRTLEIILEGLEIKNLPQEKSWRLNERHYGALQGLNKEEVKIKYGDEQFLKWRRSYDTPPPQLDITSDMNPKNDPLYSNIQSLPLSECLADTYQRVIPYWEKTIKPIVLKNSIIPINIPMSPTRFTRNAFLLALAADSFSNQNPIKRYELKPTNSQKI